MFVHMTRAQSVLDIGMFTGYSALAMAEALPDTGRLVACEVDQYVADLAQALFKRLPGGKSVGSSARDTKLAAAQESFDLVFIDADKQEYVQYFHLLLSRRTIGFICVDNTLLQGSLTCRSPSELRTGLIAESSTAS